MNVATLSKIKDSFSHHKSNEKNKWAKWLKAMLRRTLGDFTSFLRLFAFDYCLRLYPFLAMSFLAAATAFQWSSVRATRYVIQYLSLFFISHSFDLWSLHIQITPFNGSWWVIPRYALFSIVQSALYKHPKLFDYPLKPVFNNSNYPFRCCR